MLLFGGKDREHVRVTEEGRVGVGTDTPQATLDGVLLTDLATREADSTDQGNIVRQLPCAVPSAAGCMSITTRRGPRSRS